jgi:hypothetical protein
MLQVFVPQHVSPGHLVDDSRWCRIIEADQVLPINDSRVGCGLLELPARPGTEAGPCSTMVHERQAQMGS